MDESMLPAGQVVPINEHHKEFYSRISEVCRLMAVEGKIGNREILALLSQITGQVLATQDDEPGECYLSMMVNINYGQLTVHQQISDLISTMMNVRGSA